MFIKVKVTILLILYLCGTCINENPLECEDDCTYDDYTWNFIFKEEQEPDGSSDCSTCDPELQWNIQIGNATIDMTNLTQQETPICPTESDIDKKKPPNVDLKPENTSSRIRPIIHIKSVSQSKFQPKNQLEDDLKPPRIPPTGEPPEVILNIQFKKHLKALKDSRKTKPKFTSDVIKKVKDVKHSVDIEIKRVPSSGKSARPIVHLKSLSKPTTGPVQDSYEDTTEYPASAPGSTQVTINLRFKALLDALRDLLRKQTPDENLPEPESSIIPIQVPSHHDPNKPLIFLKSSSSSEQNQTPQLTPNTDMPKKHEDTSDEIPKHVTLNLRFKDHLRTLKNTSLKQPNKPMSKQPAHGPTIELKSSSTDQPGHTQQKPISKPINNTMKSTNGAPKNITFTLHFKDIPKILNQSVDQIPRTPFPATGSYPSGANSSGTPIVHLESSSDPYSDRQTSNKPPSTVPNHTLKGPHDVVPSKVPKSTKSTGSKPDSNQSTPRRPLNNPLVKPYNYPHVQPSVQPSNVVTDPDDFSDEIYTNPPPPLHLFNELNPGLENSPSNESPKPWWTPVWDTPPDEDLGYPPRAENNNFQPDRLPESAGTPNWVPSNGDYDVPILELDPSPYSNPHPSKNSPSSNSNTNVSPNVKDNTPLAYGDVTHSATDSPVSPYEPSIIDGIVDLSDPFDHTNDDRNNPYDTAPPTASYSPEDTDFYDGVKHPIHTQKNTTAKDLDTLPTSNNFPGGQDRPPNNSGDPDILGDPNKPRGLGSGSPKSPNKYDEHSRYPNGSRTDRPQPSSGLDHPTLTRNNPARVSPNHNVPNHQTNEPNKNWGNPLKDTLTKQLPNNTGNSGKRKPLLTDHQITNPIVELKDPFNDMTDHHLPRHDQNVSMQPNKNNDVPAPLDHQRENSDRSWKSPVEEEITQKPDDDYNTPILLLSDDLEQPQLGQVPDRNQQPVQKNNDRNWNNTPEQTADHYNKKFPSRHPGVNHSQAPPTDNQFINPNSRTQEPVGETLDQLPNINSGPFKPLPSSPDHSSKHNTSPRKNKYPGTIKPSDNQPIQLPDDYEDVPILLPLDYVDSDLDAEHTTGTPDETPSYPQSSMPNSDGKTNKHYRPNQVIPTDSPTEGLPDYGSINPGRTPMNNPYGNPNIQRNNPGDISSNYFPRNSNSFENDFKKPSGENPLQNLPGAPNSNHYDDTHDVKSPNPYLQRGKNRDPEDHTSVFPDAGPDETPSLPQTGVPNSDRNTNSNHQPSQIIPSNNPIDDLPDYWTTNPQRIPTNNPYDNPNIQWNNPTDVSSNHFPRNGDPKHDFNKPLGENPLHSLPRAPDGNNNERSNVLPPSNPYLPRGQNYNPEDHTSAVPGAIPNETPSYPQSRVPNNNRDRDSNLPPSQIKPSNSPTKDLPDYGIPNTESSPTNDPYGDPNIQWNYPTGVSNGHKNRDPEDQTNKFPDARPDETPSHPQAGVRNSDGNTNNNHRPNQAVPSYNPIDGSPDYRTTNPQRIPTNNPYGNPNILWNNPAHVSPNHFPRNGQYGDPKYDFNRPLGENPLHNFPRAPDDNNNGRSSVLSPQNPYLPRGQNHDPEDHTAVPGAISNETPSYPQSIVPNNDRDRNNNHPPSQIDPSNSPTKNIPDIGKPNTERSPINDPYAQPNMQWNYPTGISEDQFPRNHNPENNFSKSSGENPLHNLPKASDQNHNNPHTDPHQDNAQSPHPGEYPGLFPDARNRQPPWLPQSGIPIGEFDMNNTNQNPLNPGPIFPPTNFWGPGYNPYPNGYFNGPYNGMPRNQYPFPIGGFNDPYSPTDRLWPQNLNGPYGFHNPSYPPGYYNPSMYNPLQIPMNENTPEIPSGTKGVESTGPSQGSNSSPLPQNGPSSGPPTNKNLHDTDEESRPLNGDDNNDNQVRKSKKPPQSTSNAQNCSSSAQPKCPQNPSMKTDETGNSPKPPGASKPKVQTAQTAATPKTPSETTNKPVDVTPKPPSSPKSSDTSMDKKNSPRKKCSVCPKGKRVGNGKEAGLYWRDYYGQIPEDAIIGGHVVRNPGNRVPIYLAHAFLPNKFYAAIQPGQFFSDSTSLALSYMKIVHHVKMNIKILCGDQEAVAWVSAYFAHPLNHDVDVVRAGYEKNYNLTFARSIQDGKRVIGKAAHRGKVMHLPHNGKEIVKNNFDVLCYRKNLIRKKVRFPDNQLD